MRSRLKQNIKNQNTKTLVVIVGIIILLGIFGTQLLVGFSVVLDRLKGKEDQAVETQSVDYIAPPVLNPLPDATNQESIEVSGFTTTNDVSIQLYVNGDSAGTTMPKQDNTFIFHTTKLNSGSNEIKARSVVDSDKKSSYSKSVKIKYLNKEPALEISSPSDGQKFKKDQSPIRVIGKTDPGARVTVNDFWTITNDNGDFYYMYNLKEGGNNLKIISSDEAGNKTAKEININVE